MPYAQSRDGTSIYFESSGGGDSALLFVHGWIGNLRWWDAQRDAFAGKATVALDLAGHGKSGKGRKVWSVENYAEDIRAVADAAGLERVTLVGHSMSGAHATVACGLLGAKVERLVLVDTLQNLDQMPTMKEVGMLFEGMRANYEGTVRMAFPTYMFTPESPPAVVERVVGEAMKVHPSLAADLLRCLYETDIRAEASAVKAPVRAINSALMPTSAEANRKYFRDFDFEVIEGVGHYPMLEKPAEFNAALGRALGS